jgi:hypothetical protein
MTILVNLPAVRPGRLAERVSAESAAEPVRALRTYLRGATVTDIPDGVRLRFQLDVAIDIARLADEIRTLANEWPFLSFFMVTDPPDCALDVTGTGAAVGMARTVFAELGA